jgi:murein endopeptidase
MGLPWAGRLVGGVRLPAEGRDFFTWDPVLKRSPNRPWRRWGTGRLIRVVLRILRKHRAAYPFAPRVGIGDLSRRRGGNFGRRFGGIGHASHQNGLDVDLYYPRLDGLELQPRHVGQIDLELAQDLVDRFVAAGAEWVFVGPRTALRGPRGRVAPLVNHDDHIHVRIRPR